MTEFKTQPVVFEERPAANGARIGIARLNAEKTLNSLSLEMIDLLSSRMATWAGDQSVALVLLEAAGERSFSAGADLHRMHKTMLEHRASPQKDDIRANTYAADFFSREYRLDFIIHTFPKPVLCWGHGIVMGGGVGLMSGASHRVVTPESRIAMPEITIGLFADVGGSWLLGRMPGQTGLFLALTGARIQPADALFVKLADYCIAQADKSEVLAKVLAQSWGKDRMQNSRILDRVLRGHALKLQEQGPLRRNFDLIGELCQGDDAVSIVDAISGCKTDDPWLQRAAATLAAGSPSSAALTFELLRRAKHMSLAEVFRMEFLAALHCAQRPDLAEGIRALLIDKDQKPRWKPATLAAVTPEWIEGYFTSPWHQQDHPLADLGSTHQGGR